MVDKMMVKFNPEKQELTINGAKLDLEILAILCDPRPRLLWRFLWVDGVVQAIPYDETKVIWIDPPSAFSPE